MSAKKTLHIVESAYRATLEEQDDTVLWLTQALKGAGHDAHILLRGGAVNYLVRGQDASGLAFGEKRQSHPPALEQDIERMMGKGIEVRFVAEDARERGLESAALLAGAKAVPRSSLPQLLESYDHVWHW